VNVAVVGIGPVGIVTASGLARAGHRVHATDREASRVDALREGRTPIVEPGLAARVAESVASAGSSPRIRSRPAVSHANGHCCCASERPRCPRATPT
jgi:GDP-mannose 6-dehydrogenase